MTTKLINYFGEDCKLLPEINIVQQEPNNCVCACISMFTGIDQKLLAELINYDYLSGISEIEELYILDKIGVKYIRYTNWWLVPGRLQLISVDSLNQKVHKHRILSYSELCPSDITRFYDPNYGIEGKNWYPELYSANSSSTPFPNFSDVIEIIGFIPTELGKELLDRSNKLLTTNNP